MTSSRPVSIARRRAWVVALAVAGGLLGAILVSVLQPAAYTAGATLLVTTDDSFNATRLAQTYANALPDDGGLLREVSDAVGADEEQVAGALSVKAESETAVLRLEYRAPSEQDAVDGATAAVRAVTGTSPEAISIPADVLEVIRAPRVLSAPAPGISPAALAVGAILGLFLGVVLATGLERSDRRVDGADDLVEALRGTPVTRLTRRHGGLTPALLERWRSLSGSPAPSVALVSIGRVGGAALEALAARAASASDSEPAGGDPGPAPTVVAGGPLGADGGAEMASQQTDMTVLVVRRGTPEREVEAGRALLEQFGVTPRWGLLIS
jgi:capsular polysaccharide biosynthesis protein